MSHQGRMVALVAVWICRISVAEADRGKVIGRGGRIVRALRTLVRAGGVREGRRYLLEIVE